MSPLTRFDPSLKEISVAPLPHVPPLYSACFSVFLIHRVYETWPFV